MFQIALLLAVFLNTSLFLATAGVVEVTLEEKKLLSFQAIHADDLFKDNPNKRVVLLNDENDDLLEKEATPEKNNTYDFKFEVVDPDEPILTKRDVIDDVLLTHAISQIAYKKAIPSLDLLLCEINDRRDQMLVAECFFDTLWKENLSSYEMERIINAAFESFHRISNPERRIRYICGFLNAPNRGKFIALNSKLASLMHGIEFPDDPISRNQLMDFVVFTDSLDCLDWEDQRETFKVFFNFGELNKNHYLGFLKALERKIHNAKKYSTIIAAFLRATDVDGNALRENIVRIKRMKKYVSLIAINPHGLIDAFARIKGCYLHEFDDRLVEIKEGIRICDPYIRRTSKRTKLPGIKNNTNLTILIEALSKKPARTWRDYFNAVAFFAPKMKDELKVTLAFLEMLNNVEPGDLDMFATEVKDLTKDATPTQTVELIRLFASVKDGTLISIFELFSTSKMKDIDDRMALLDALDRKKPVEVYTLLHKFQKRVPFLTRLFVCEAPIILTPKQYKNL